MGGFIAHGFWRIGQGMRQIWHICTLMLLPGTDAHLDRAYAILGLWERDRLELDTSLSLPARWVGHLSHQVSNHPSLRVETVILVPVGQSATTKDAHLLDIPLASVRAILDGHLQTLWWWQRPLLLNALRGRCWGSYADRYTTHARIAALKRRATWPPHVGG